MKYNESIYRPRGACSEVMRTHQPEILLEGPAGTGKSRAILEKLQLVGLKYPNCRLLMVRKTRISLNTSGRVTFEQKVALPAVQWEASKSQYAFPNGSVLVVGGLDKASRILSTEYDVIYVQEATEISQTDWETLLTRLRNAVVPYQQIIGDCNPGAPTHWLLKRARSGYLKRLYSKHTDNPMLWDEDRQEWTEKGEAYISLLMKLTGHTRERLFKGIWAAASGMVYPEFDHAEHLVEPFTIPIDWKRYLAVDFGYIHPFVCQWWAVSPDDTMYLYREIYHTERTVKSHAEQILKYCEQDPGRRPVAICDHDAEDRATLEENGIRTKPAHKSVGTGIENTKFRMVEGKLKIFRGATVEMDLNLDQAGLPTATEEEFGGYVWNPSTDAPVKEKDHGMDALRYAVMELDYKRARRTVRSMR